MENKKHFTHEKIRFRKYTKHENNKGFYYTGLYSDKTSFFIHKEGIVAISLSKTRFFWNGTKEAIIHFVKDGVEYWTAIDRVINERSLALLIDRFVKDCISLSKSM